MTFPEQIGQRALVPDQHVCDQIGDYELHLRRRCRLDDATFENQTAKPELALARVCGVFLESVGGGHVEDQLVLEAVEDDDDEAGDAAEGEGVGPEASGLELAGAGPDVDGFGPGRAAAGGGEEAESEGLDSGWERLWLWLELGE